MTGINARTELDELEKDSVAWLDRLLREAVVGNIKATSRSERDEIQAKLASALVRQQGTADLLGRRRLYLDTHGEDKKRSFARYEIPEEETAEEFLKKMEALTTPEAKQIVEEHRKSMAAYMLGASVLAAWVIKKATKAVYKLIRREVKGGLSRDGAEEKVIKALQDRDPSVTITKSYAETVFKTNLNTAYTNARTQQATTPAFSGKVVAWKYVTMEDERVRHNHAAAHDFVAHVTDPIWKKISPPMGFNCRCVLEGLGLQAAQRAGAANDNGIAVYKSAPIGAHPDTGFKAG
jgi:SPP1 gp7 family putative phage head morphogenesis protein